LPNFCALWNACIFSWGVLIAASSCSRCYLSVRRAVGVTVRLAPLPMVTCGRTQAVASVTCIRPAAVKDSACRQGWTA
jgi:hypothetical protein